MTSNFFLVPDCLRIIIHYHRNPSFVERSRFFCCHYPRATDAGSLHEQRIQSMVFGVLVEKNGSTVEVGV